MRFVYHKVAWRQVCVALDAVTPGALAACRRLVLGGAPFGQDGQPEFGVFKACGEMAFHNRDAPRRGQSIGNARRETSALEYLQHIFAPQRRAADHNDRAVFLQIAVDIGAQRVQRTAKGVHLVCREIQQRFRLQLRGGVEEGVQPHEREAFQGFGQPLEIQRKG